MYTHWMQKVPDKARKTLEQTREAIKKYYDQRATPEPETAIGDLVMLNAKNIRTKRPTKKLRPSLYGPFKVLEKRGNRPFKLDISPHWKIHPVFHLSLLEPDKVSYRPYREQPPREPEDVEGDMEWEVEKIVKSERITYRRKVRRVDKEFKELGYLVKWAGYSEDENTCELPQGLVNAREIVEKFHRENPWMPGPNLVEQYGKVFLKWTSKSSRFLPLPYGAQKVKENVL